MDVNGIEAHESFRGGVSISVDQCDASKSNEVACWGGEKREYWTPVAFLFFKIGASTCYLLVMNFQEETSDWFPRTVE